MKRVLLTNGQLRKTLAAVRSLGEKGIKTFVAEETRFSPAAFSRHCSHSLVYPSPRKYPAEFYEWLVKAIKKYDIEIVYPMDEDSLDVVMEHKDELDKLCLLHVPPVESYRIASDKARAYLLAKDEGLDCPETYIPHSIEEVETLASELSYPVVIKPRKSSGSRGIRIVEKKEELVPVYTDIHQIFPLPIIQEFLDYGQMFDISLLFNSNSRLRASFIYRQVRKFPIKVGPSTVQESIWNPDWAKKAASLMEKLNWVGVADIEFLLDEKDGKFKFIEINPRYWNSLYAAIIAGVDFPWLQYKIITQGDVEPVPTYKEGMFCRNLLPGDILHFISNKDRLKLSPSFFAGRRQGVYDDIISAQDPMPSVGFILACLRYLPDKNMWKLIFKR